MADTEVARFVPIRSGPGGAAEVRDSPLILRLGAYARLSPPDKAALEQLCRTAVQAVAARSDLVREGDRPRGVLLLIEGWAVRYKTLADGRRQAVGFLLPGDFCDLNVHVLQAMDHGIAAITPARVANIPAEEMERLAELHPATVDALWWNDLVGASIQREWLLSLGQRIAYERIGHLLVELFYRARAVGLAEGRECPLPLTQNDIADATGLTAVHVNRTLQDLRREGLIVLERKRLRLPDLDRLAAAVQFNPDYLHLDDARGDDARG